jgi:hypothetical protein
LAAVGQPVSAPKPAPEVESPERRPAQDSHEVRDLRKDTPPVETQAQQDSLERQPILAVRAGPAPVESLRFDMEAALRDVLAEHAALRRVGEVLSIETPTQEPEPELRLPGESVAGAEAELTLPGAGESRPAEEKPAAPPPVGPGRLVSTAPLQAAERQRELEPSTRRENEVQTSAVASNTGGIQNPDDPRRAELPGERSDPAATAVAEAALTQGGVVEAAHEGEIVTRFFEGTELEDAGPEPRPEQKLGERSVPFSTYA